MNTTTLMLLMMTILCTSTAQILQKQAAMELSDSSNQSALFNPSIIKSMALLVCGMGLWLLVLNNMDVSVAYPLLSANFIVVHLMAKWKFREEIPAHRIMGALIIIAGMAFLFTGESQ